MDNNFKKKNKFVENSNIEYNKQPYYEIDKTVNLKDDLKNKYNSKVKSKIELKDNLDPYNYELNYYNKIKKDVKGQDYIYYAPYDQGPGRGFGNLNVNNNIRNSESSRTDIDDFRLYRESGVIDRFEFIDNRYSNTRNLVLPFPRAGDTTRKISVLGSSTDIHTDYKFNTPFLQNNQTQAVSDGTMYLNPDDITTEIPSLPNLDIVYDIEDKNEKQRNNQKIYLENINKIQNIITTLQQKYGNKVTRKMIETEINKYPDLQNIYSQLPKKVNNY